MIAQAYTYKNDHSVMFDKDGPLYRVIWRDAAGNVRDKVRCDDYRMAREYLRAFKESARKA